MDKPVNKRKASLLLSTYNMPRHLELVFAALESQSTRDFEIILCDDGSDAETAAVIEGFKKTCPVPFHHVWQEHHGFRKSRILNTGIRKSTGDILIFLDGDCVPHTRFIQDHIEQSESGRYLAGRRIELGPEISEKLTPEKIISGYFDSPSLDLFKSVLKNDSTHFHRALRIGWQPLRQLLKMDQVDDLKGCNFSVDRQSMISINGFDESYEGYGREDTDVELRLQHLGLRIKSLKGLALQFHVWHPRRNFTPTNETLLENVKKEKRIRALRGLESTQ